MFILSNYQEVAPSRWRTVFTFKCDACHIIYSKVEKKNRRNKPTHYCSLRCANLAQQKDGPLDVVRREIFRHNLGVDYPQQSSAVRQQSIETCLLRYGVENVQQVDEIKQRSVETFNKNHERMGSCTSKDEKRFHERLLAYFNADDIVTQKFVHGTRRPIDFYIKSIDTYVQFDGVYWHGLDRPIEEIMQHKTKHDKEISSRPASDRQQNEWFKKQGMKLVRVTDVEFTTMLFDEILERIRS